MKSHFLSLILFSLLATYALPSHAQVSANDREVEKLKTWYQSTRYADVLSHAKTALEVITFTDEQLLEIHQLAGLSAFNLNDNANAERHFFRLLQLNPDAILDPFAVLPSLCVVAGFDMGAAVTRCRSACIDAGRAVLVWIFHFA